MCHLQATMDELLTLVLGDTSTTPQQHHNEYEEIDYEDGDNLKEHPED